VHLSIFISVFNQLDAQNLFHNKFYFIPLHVSSTCARHQEVKISLHSLWYHHTYRWNKFCASSWLNTEIKKLFTASHMFDEPHTFHYPAISYYHNFTNGVCNKRLTSTWTYELKKMRTITLKEENEQDKHSLNWSYKTDSTRHYKLTPLAVQQCRV